jgi:beta-lactamase class A
MTSVGKGLGLALVIAATTQVSASAATKPASPKPVRPAAPVVRTPVVPAPQYIRDRIDALGRTFDGRVGIAVKSIDDGWETGW